MQSIEKEPMDENAVKKETLLFEINFIKNNLPIWRRTPESIRMAEAILKKIKGDFVSPEDQFKLYQSFAKFKPKSKLMEMFENNIIALLIPKVPTFQRGGRFYREYYFTNLNALLEAEAIPDASTFKRILKKNPEEIHKAIETISNDRTLDRKEMLQWLAQVEDPKLVTNTILMCAEIPYSPTKGKEIQIRSNIINSLGTRLGMPQTEALLVFINSSRSASDLSPAFVEEVFKAKDPIDLIAQDYIDNPHRIPKIRAALPDQDWTKEKLKEIISFYKGKLLSEEAEHKLWDKIPLGFCKDGVYERIITTRMSDTDKYFGKLEKFLSQIGENKISPTISAEIKNYESKRWFWERWFFKLPEPIVKAKEILDSGTGTYKNLDLEKQFELLRCLNEATKKDKRSSEVLAVFEGALRFKYQSNDPNYKDFETILTMVKEGIIDNPQKFEVATQKAQHWVSECYKHFNANNTDKNLRELAWSLIFNHNEPEKLAEAISLLAERNLVDHDNLASIQASQNPLSSAQDFIKSLDEHAQPKGDAKAIKSDDSIMDITELGKQPLRSESGQPRQKLWPRAKEHPPQESSKSDTNKPKTSWAKRKSMSEPPEEPKTSSSPSAGKK